MSVSGTFMETKIRKPLPCPECGAVELVTMTGDCLMTDGTVIPDLERLQCRACGEKLFSPESVDKIQRIRNLKKRRPVNA